jgi:hypothetical protein
MAQLPALKSGDTFTVTVTYSDPTGAPINLTISDIVPSAQVRDGDLMLIAPLAVVVLDQTAFPGMFTLSAATGTWPINTQLGFDIKYTTGGTIITHTDATYFRVESAITQ